MNKKFFYIFIIFCFSQSFLIFFPKFKFFYKYSDYEYDVLLYKKSNVYNKSANVLVIGDSSGLRGINPLYFKKKNITMHNLSTYGRNGKIGYELLLDNYLKYNELPKTIVLNTILGHPIVNFVTSESYERTLTILKLGSFKDILTHLYKNPKSIKNYYTRIYKRILTPWANNDFSSNYFNNMIMELQETNGFLLTIQKPLDDNCKINSKEYFIDWGKKMWGKDFRKFELNYLFDLKKKYERLGINFIIYGTPSPFCEYAFEFYKENLKSVLDNAPIQLDNDLFWDYTHVNKKGSEILSKNLFNFLKNKNAI